MFVRVTEAGKPAFQLRNREEGISVFDVNAVEPPLTEAEILEAFREGSTVVLCSADAVAAVGLQVAPIAGAEPLPERLREAHAEIRPVANMTRPQFKAALKELEQHESN